MKVTLFELNSADKRTAISVLNRNEMHRDIQAMFGGDRQNERNVYRIVERKGKLLLYIYSEYLPDLSKAHFGMKYLGSGDLPVRHTGDNVMIDMLVTPIRTMTGYDGKKRKRPIFNADERISWCRRKAAENGLEVEELIEVKKEHLRVDKHDGAPWIIDAYEYKLRGRITDEDMFMNCMIKGFGRNGAYGAGMMIIR